MTMIDIESKRIGPMDRIYHIKYSTRGGTFKAYADGDLENEIAKDPSQKKLIEKVKRFDRAKGKGKRVPAIHGDRFGATIGSIPSVKVKSGYRGITLSPVFTYMENGESHRDEKSFASSQDSLYTSYTLYEVTPKNEEIVKNMDEITDQIGALSDKRSKLAKTFEAPLTKERYFELAEIDPAVFEES